MSGMNLVRAYGDTTGDGMVQLSFTLPVPAGPRAQAAAASAPISSSFRLP